jgi:hypothetical protein
VTAGIPRLSLVQAMIARTLAAQTGIDGHAAAFMVADVAEHGHDSPHAAEVTCAARAVAEEIAHALRPLWAAALEVLNCAVTALQPLFGLSELAAGIAPADDDEEETCPET